LGSTRHCRRPAGALTAPALIGELRSLEQALEATRGELAVARLQLERANAIIDYSTHYVIAADWQRRSTTSPSRRGWTRGWPFAS